MDLLNQIFKINSDKEFEKLALKAFDFQMKNNDIYRLFSDKILKKKYPAQLSDIPFLPIEFFKEKKIFTNHHKLDKIFVSSGTSLSKSKHLVADLNIYEESFLNGFLNFYGDPKDYCFLALLPNYLEQKNSSLVYMINKFIEISSYKESGFVLNDFDLLAKTLKSLEKKSNKIILFGVTYSLIDFAKKHPMNLKSTTIIETGGMKGRRKELVKEEVYQILSNSFNTDNIHSEYGMTELLSQAYSKKINEFQSPSWMKIMIRDVNDPLTITEDGSGAINIIDLANLYSCPFIATEDLGRINKNNTFGILGRMDYSESRGCNLMI